MAYAHTSSLLDHANLTILTLSTQLKSYQPDSNSSNTATGENDGIFKEENPLFRSKDTLKHGKSEKSVVFAIDDRLLNIANEKESGDGVNVRRRYF